MIIQKYKPPLQRYISGRPTVLIALQSRPMRLINMINMIKLINMLESFKNSCKLHDPHPPSQNFVNMANMLGLLKNPCNLHEAMAVHSACRRCRALSLSSA